MSARFRIGVTLCASAFAAAVYAATALRFGPELNVSGTPTPTEKAKSCAWRTSTAGPFAGVALHLWRRNR